MNWLQNILPPNWTYALGWTVVHSLWQGLLIASIMAFVMMGLQRKSAALRYRVAFGALFTMFLSAIGTFAFLLEKATYTEPDNFYEALILRGLIFEASVENQPLMQRVSLFFNENLYLIVSIWLIGVAFFTLRLMGGLMYVQQLRTKQRVSLSAEWQSRMNFFKNKLGVRYAVSLAESAMVSVPMVVGWLKPLILMPIGTVNSMSTAQVEAILAHELAHIAHRDYLLNIAQSVIEILFYYHPAAWWISANIRAERENRCDDVAVLLCGNSLTYAKALLSLQEMQLHNVRTYGLALTLAGKNKHFLLKRIKRILNQPQNRSNIMEKLIATALLLAVVTALSFGNNKTISNIQSGKTPPSVNSLLSADTLPPKGKMTIIKEENDKKVEMKVEDGNITELKIDGKDIPKQDFDKYEDVTDGLLYGLPPTPPMPPAAPMPPSPFAAPMPPTPPTPPTAPTFPRTTLKKEKDSEGNTILKMKKGDGSYSEIKITTDKEVFIDGKKMEEGKDMKLNLGDNAFYHFNFDNTWAKSFEGFEKFNFDNHFDFVMPKIKMKGLEGELLRRPHSFYFMDIDSMKMGDGTDSTRVYKLKNKIKYDFNWSDEDVQHTKENAKRMADEARRNAERYRKDAQQMRRETQLLTREKQLLTREKEREYRYEHRDEQREEKRMEMGSLRKAFESELQKDGFLKEGDKKYKFELNDKTLKINGKEQSKAMHEKYMKRYKEKSGSRANGNFNIQFTED